MANKSTHEIDTAYKAITAVVRDRLSRNERIRRNLPGDGRVRIDRQLPFLCVYRMPAEDRDAGTCDLVTTEAAYLFSTAEVAHRPGLQSLVAAIAETMREHFGAFLLIEIWADDDHRASSLMSDALQPGFRIVAQRHEWLEEALASLETALLEVRVHGKRAEVEFDCDERSEAAWGRNDIGPLHESLPGVYSIGIAVRPVYRDVHLGTVYPLVLQSLRRQLAVAIRKAVFAFTGQSDHRPPAHFESLGPSSMVKAARLVDQELREVSQSFDFILQTAPLNSNSSWKRFRSSGYAEDPVLYYRPLPYDPAELKRRLFAIPIDRIEDASLIHLFAEKQDHLDRQLTALKNIDSRAFYYDSIQLYGTPDAELVKLARGILAQVASREHELSGEHSQNGDLQERSCELVSADELATAARDEIDFYHQQLPSFAAKVEVRDDVVASMMVAHDKLYIAASAALHRHAVGPLLHHEIGTHLLTYFNGQQQPLQQLYAGLARYEELQEGLAVLAEYLVGGWTPSRLRTIACRVLAVQALVEGRSFAETFRLLHEEHGQGARAAFTTTLRVFRGGGLTKDAIYLRGLRNLLDYLRAGHSAEPLYVGKIALEHVPLVQELRRRGVVGPPTLLPRFWDDAESAKRLERCRLTSLLELVEQDP